MIYEKNQWFSNFKYMYKDFAYFSFAKRKKWNSSVKLLYSCVEKLLFFRKIDFYVKLTVYLFISRRNVNAAKKYYKTRSRKKKKKIRVINSLVKALISRENVDCRVSYSSTSKLRIFTWENFHEIAYFFKKN